MLQTRVSQTRRKRGVAGQYASQKRNGSPDLGSYQPLLRAKLSTFSEYRQFAGSLRGNSPMREALAWQETWPSGMRTATHAAPLPPGPVPTISRIQASWVSAMENDSPSSP